MSIHSQYLISQHFMKRFSEPSSSSSCSSSQSPDSKRQRCSEDSASDSESESDEGGCQKGRSELLLTHLSMFRGKSRKKIRKQQSMVSRRQESKAFWMGDRSANVKNHVTKLWTLRWSSNCAWRFGVWQNQPKIAFFGVSRTWQQTWTTWKIPTVVPIQNHLILGPSLKILDKAPKRSNWIVGTFKAGHWLQWLMLQVFEHNTIS